MTEREGACHCGQLRVVVSGEPGVVSICNCGACQRRTGSAFGIQARYRADQVRILGRFNVFSRVSDESDRREHIFHFCPDCGSSVFHTEPTEPEKVVVFVGAFADKDFPQPTISGYDHLRHPWLEVPETVWAHGQDFALWNQTAKLQYEDGRYADAADTGRALLAEHPDQAYLHFNVACCESRAGRVEAALDHLRQAVQRWDGFVDMARGDSDFDAIRANPAFRDLVGD